MRVESKKRKSLRIIALGAWIIGILIPLYSISRLSEPAKTAFDQVFASQTSHVLMHMFLYAVLAALIFSFVADNRSSPIRPLLIALIGTAAIAMLQEGIQLRAEGLLLGHDEVFDFFIDLSGGLLGSMFFLYLRRREETGDEGRNKTVSD